VKPLDPRAGTVRGLLEQINLEVAALPDPYVRSLIPAMVQAERELSTDLAGLVGRMGEYNAQMLRRALLQARGGLNAIERVRPEMLSEMVKAGHAAGQLATRHLSRELAKFSMHYDKTLTPVPLVPASKLSQRLLLDRFATRTSKWSQVARDRIRRELTVGMIRGETIAQTAARLQGRGKKYAEVLAEKGAQEQGDALASGLWRMTKYEAKRIVHTETIHAYNEHAHDQLKQLRDDDPRIRQQWCAVIDGRTCKDCLRLDGEVVDIGEPFPGCLRDEPPLHPFCRCCRVAWRADWPTGGDRLHGLDNPLDSE